VTTSEAAVARRPGSTADLTRRNQILDLAAVAFAASGFRTSLKEIADACGILPGSLYHHFSSKDALIAELVERYVADLDVVAAAALAALPATDGGAVADHVIAIAAATSGCALRHRAAVAMTFFEPPSGASDALVRAAQ